MNEKQIEIKKEYELKLSFVGFKKHDIKRIYNILEKANLLKLFQ